MFGSTKTISFLTAVLAALVFIFSACSSSDAEPVSQETASEQIEAPAEENDTSAKQDDDASAQEITYEDGLGEDGLIHVYLVGEGEEVSSFDSSFIDYLIYYKESGHLIIAMNGKEYTYANVSEAMWEDFKNADSKGSFYNAEIKDRSEYHIKDYDGTNGDLIVVENVDD